MEIKINLPLPGKKAHVRMAPEYRVRTLSKEIVPDNAREAAVLVLLTPKNQGLSTEEMLDWDVLLIRRNHYLGVHSGQIALPGGKVEKKDTDFWETGCRETFEEVGIEHGFLEKVGPVSNIYIPPSNFIIHPFVAINNWKGELVPDHREVVDYKYVPIKTFNPGKSVLMEFETGQGRSNVAPAWQYEDYIVWGATAMILSELHSLVVNKVLTRSS